MTIAYKARCLRQATPDQVKSALTYNPDTGVFLWRFRTGGDRHTKNFNARFAGKVAGGLHSAGYWVISGALAHRLAWLMMYRKWPDALIDHINGNKLDNRISNLRECDDAENAQNVAAHKGSSSRHVGVSLNGHSKSKPWQAHVCVSGKQHFLGYFETEAEALAARISGKQKLHQFHPQNPQR